MRQQILQKQKLDQDREREKTTMLLKQAQQTRRNEETMKKYERIVEEYRSTQKKREHMEKLQRQKAEDALIRSTFGTTPVCMQGTAGSSNVSIS